MRVRTPDLDSLRRILVVQTAGIGDALLTTPAVRALLDRCKPEVLDTLTKPFATEIFGQLEGVREARGLGRTTRGTLSELRRIRRERYDLLVDFHCKARTLWFAVLGGIPFRLGLGPERIGVRSRGYNLHGREMSDYSAAARLDTLAALGIDPEVDATPIFEPSSEGRRAAALALQERGLDGERLWGIAPATRFANKTWAQDRWFELVRSVHATTGRRAVAVIPPDDDQGVAEMGRQLGGEVLTVLPAGDLSYLAAILERLDLLVTDCSSPRHLAVSRGTPTLTLHGSTNPANWTHPAAQHRVVAARLECRPCDAVVCPLGTDECMQAISSGEVIAATQDALEHPSG
ncbi:MAG: glycosyltransferase family 9 protein [Planctomycetota bacterium]|nr:glycosyltransferase family 9 protein [Planctomycetota bacterium]